MVNAGKVALGRWTWRSDDWVEEVLTALVSVKLTIMIGIRVRRFRPLTLSQQRSI